MAEPSEFDATNYANLEVSQISVFSPATDPNHVVTKQAMENHVDSVKTEVKTYTDESIATVVGLGTPDNLNTLKELASAIANDGSVYTTLTTAIFNEASARQDAYDTLNSAVQDETQSRQSADNALTNLINDESSARESLRSDLTSTRFGKRSAEDDSLQIKPASYMYLGDDWRIATSSAGTGGRKKRLVFEVYDSSSAAWSPAFPILRQLPPEPTLVVTIMPPATTYVAGAVLRANIYSTGLAYIFQRSEDGSIFTDVAYSEESYDYKLLYTDRFVRASRPVANQTTRLYSEVFTVVVPPPKVPSEADLPIIVYDYLPPVVGCNVYALASPDGEISFSNFELYYSADGPTRDYRLAGIAVYSGVAQTTLPGWYKFKYTVLYRDQEFTLFGSEVLISA